MNNKSNIIEFPSKKIKGKNKAEIDTEADFEAGVDIQQFIDSHDYPGLVQFCMQRAERNPDDLYAQYYLGDAYVRNGEYKKAIEFIAPHYKKYPLNEDYQYVILDSLFALGKTEIDFNWVKKPNVLKMSTDIIDTCFEYLKRKRKPRSIIELHGLFITKGYLLFSRRDLLNAVLNDRRFIVDKPENDLFAEVSVVRKNKK